MSGVEYIAQRLVTHKGKQFPPGSRVTGLSKSDADVLRALGIVRPVTVPTPQQSVEVVPKTRKKTRKRSSDDG